MSLLRAAPSRILPLTRARVFSTSPFVSRSVVEGTKDALKAADRVVSDAAVKGIEKGGILPVFLPRFTLVFAGVLELHESYSIMFQIEHSMADLRD